MLQTRQAAAIGKVEAHRRIELARAMAGRIQAMRYERAQAIFQAAFGRPSRPPAGGLGPAPVQGCRRQPPDRRMDSGRNSQTDATG